MLAGVAVAAVAGFIMGRRTPSSTPRAGAETPEADAAVEPAADVKAVPVAQPKTFPEKVAAVRAAFGGLLSALVECGRSPWTLFMLAGFAVCLQVSIAIASLSHFVHALEARAPSPPADWSMLGDLSWCFTLAVALLADSFHAFARLRAFYRWVMVNAWILRILIWL